MAIKHAAMVPDAIPERDECTYTACYCEENIWKLCSIVQETCTESECSKCFCIFISNDSKKIPLWHQRASNQADGLVVWDYHVIFIYLGNGGALVYDLDTNLSFPCTLKEYVGACIGDERLLKEEYRRLYRVIPAKEFLGSFASDRSHMLNEDGIWLSPPPTYPPIQCEDSSNNISEFISMDKNIMRGQVLNQQELLCRFEVR